MDYHQIEDGVWQGGSPPFGIPFGISIIPDHIRAVLNLCELQNVVHPGRLDANLWLPIPDSEPFPGNEFLVTTTNFIEFCRIKKLDLLIHCAAGISRSSLVTTAWLMRHKKLGFVDALNYLRTKRPIAGPNGCFCDGLKRYEKVIGITK